LRLGATGSLILGAAGAASAANVTNGTVVFNASPNISAAQLSPKGTHNFVYFDVTEDGTNDFLIDSFNLGGSKGTLAPDVQSGMPMYLSAGNALQAGSIVGPDQAFLYYDGPTDDSDVTAATLSSGESYYGFSFTDGSTNYGWLKVSFESTTVSVLGWAYDTSGAAIAVGSTSAIPEASTTTLSMGAAALLAGSAAAWRRRKTRLPAAI
jgi:hypothetical protein